MDQPKYPGDDRNRHCGHARGMPVLSNNDSDENHAEVPEEHRHWVAEAQVESFVHLPLSSFLGYDRFDSIRCFLGSIIQRWRPLVRP